MRKNGMYWALDNQPPTLDEIVAQGEVRIRNAVEAACARYEAPQLPIPAVEPLLTDEDIRLMEKHVRQLERYLQMCVI